MHKRNLTNGKLLYRSLLSDDEAEAAAAKHAFLALIDNINILPEKSILEITRRAVFRYNYRDLFELITSVKNEKVIDTILDNFHSSTYTYAQSLFITSDRW